MRIQYASDLHLEFEENAKFLELNPLKPAGDVLILAGDIAVINQPNFVKQPFWDAVSQQYERVLMVPGNHEFYLNGDIAARGG